MTSATLLLLSFWRTAIIFIISFNFTAKAGDRTLLINTSACEHGTMRRIVSKFDDHFRCIARPRFTPV